MDGRAPRVQRLRCLDVWANRTQTDALRAGAVLAMDCGMDEDVRCNELFAAGRWAAVLERYEELSPKGHLLREQAAFLQVTHDGDLPGR